MMLHAMIMAGGGGTRFWPRSRNARPKQFLTFSGDRTLLQATLDRVTGPIPAERSWVITGAAHAGEAHAQLPDLAAEHIVGEPFGRDTAACIGLGAALIAKSDPDAVMLVMPADHVIEPIMEFQRAIHAAAQFAEEFPNALLTFGIPPTYPATGYGYIQHGEAMGQRQGVTISRVQAFKEKPDADTAERFLASGEFSWNSGIFVWKAATILRELRANCPQIADAVERIAAAWGTPKRDEVFRSEYESLSKISIDFAVMEKAKDVMVIQAPYQWDDVGSWLALERRNPQDAHGNTVQANHTGLSTENCVIVGDTKTLITTIGVKNLLIVQDGDAILVADRNDEATVKNLVDQLKKEGKGQYL
jgi:mannose-1-phosphate guanylyltransferase